MSTDDPALKPGTALAGFQIQRALGAGGFGITYLAKDLKNGRPYALKEFFPIEICHRGKAEAVSVVRGKSTAFERGLDAFFEEARLLRQLPKTAGLLSVRGLFKKNGTAYVVSEFIDGGAVSDQLTRFFAQDQKIPEHLIREFLEAMTNALATVHEQGLIHRDIKPDNIMVRKSDRQPVLIDFGASKYIVSDNTGHAIYTPNFAAIEQFPPSAGGPDARLREGPWTDIYSLSLVAYVMMTARRVPRSDRRYAAIKAGQPDPYVPLVQSAQDTYSADLCEMIDLGCALMPDDRPADARSFFNMLVNNDVTKTVAFQEHSYFGRADDVSARDAAIARQPQEKVRPKQGYSDKKPWANYWLVLILLAAVAGVTALGVYVLDVTI